MVDLSAKKPPYSREEIEASLLEYVFSEASNEPDREYGRSADK